MDALLGAGKERPFLFQPSPSASSSAVPDGYFATQALRAGYIGGPRDDVQKGGSVPEPASAREMLHREMLKRRIREEIVAREMAERRMLEDEVRRELALERAAMAMRRFQGNVFSPVGPVAAFEGARVSFARVDPGVGDERRMMGAAVSAGGLFGERMADVRLPSNADKGGFFLPWNEREDKGSAFASGPGANPPKATVAGIKRKASKFLGIDQKKPGKLLRLTKGDWSCALCQVSATSKENLDHHLQGKKHKAQEALLGVVKEAGGTSTVPADKPLALVKGVGPKKPWKNLVGKNLLRKGTGPSPVKKQKTRAGLWCELCKLECNSDSMLASHLGGKRHRAKLEESDQRQGAAARTRSKEKRAALPLDNKVANELNAEIKVVDSEAGL